MGCFFSSKRFSSSPKLKNIRIVHFNGYIEEIDYPITVAELTGNPPKHLLFTHAQLLAAGSTPLKLDTPLEQGRVYFLLPYTLLGSTVSPVDLAPLARKLVAIAQNNRKRSRSGSRSASSSDNSPVWSSPAASPNRHFSDTSDSKTENDQVFCGTHKPSKLRQWKPFLTTIRERSFNRRSESDLQENA